MLKIHTYVEKKDEILRDSFQHLDLLISIAFHTQVSKLQNTFVRVLPSNKNSFMNIPENHCQQL